MRIATLNTDLERDGPGLLLRDILRGEDEQLHALRDVLAETAPDILLLQGVDYDPALATLQALRDWLGQGAGPYPHIFALAPNSGVPSGLDLNGDGRTGRATDAQGYGRFYGEGGMAILSRHPIITQEARDLSALLWRDLPGATLPRHADGTPFPSEAAQAVQRLSSVAHWAVPIALPEGRLTLLAFHATPPVFDGPEDRNGLRNRDELRLWQVYLDGALGPAPEGRFAIIGVANIDPVDGQGIKAGISGLLRDPRLQDPMPMRPDGLLADHAGHAGDPRLDTVAWPDPGHLRVSYILPSADLGIEGAGIHWPPAGTEGHEAAHRASAHRLVWVDLALP